MPRYAQIWRMAVQIYTEYQVKEASRKMPMTTAASDVEADLSDAVGCRGHWTVTSPPTAAMSTVSSQSQTEASSEADPPALRELPAAIGGPGRRPTQAAAATSSAVAATGAASGSLHMCARISWVAASA